MYLDDKTDTSSCHRVGCFSYKVPISTERLEYIYIIQGYLTVKTFWPRTSRSVFLENLMTLRLKTGQKIRFKEKKAGRDRFRWSKEQYYTLIYFSELYPYSIKYNIVENCSKPEFLCRHTYTHNLIILIHNTK